MERERNINTHIRNIIHNIRIKNGYMMFTLYVN